MWGIAVAAQRIRLPILSNYHPRYVSSMRTGGGSSGGSRPITATTHSNKLSAFYEASTQPYRRRELMDVAAVAIVVSEREAIAVAHPYNSGRAFGSGKYWCLRLH